MLITRAMIAMRHHDPVEFIDNLITSNICESQAAMIASRCGDE